MASAKSHVTEHCWGPPEDDSEVDDFAVFMCDWDRSVRPEALKVYHYRYRVTPEGKFQCQICGKSR